MLLTALPPFRGDGVELIKSKYRGKVMFDVVVPSRASQNLVRALLQPNPKKRFTIDQVLQSEWMTMTDSELLQHDLTLTRSSFKDF
jgi:serine/threonine protein kinase